ATCYLRLGQLNAAKTHYLKALDITPNDTQALCNVRVISMQQGRIADVFKYYQQALAVNPHLFEVHNNLGVSYLNVKDQQSALTHFYEALRLQPANAALKHTIKALTGNQTSHVESGYIKQ